jgi:hypothetical protein
MADKPVKLVIDASVVGGLTIEQREKIEAEAKDAFVRGAKEGNEELVAAARRLLEQVAEAHEAGAEIIEVPLTAEEKEDRAVREAAHAEALGAEEARTKEREKARTDLGTTLAEVDKLATKVAEGKASEAETQKALAHALAGVTALAHLLLDDRAS